MHLIDLHINEFLLVKNSYFLDSYNNIEYLNKIANETKDLEQKLSLLNIATKKIEKFHSFFHFEQSYFHLQLAIYYLQNNQEALANEQLETAIFQDHLNEEAKFLSSKKDFSNNYKYKRPFNSFTQYINFATEEVKSSTIETPLDSYWNLLDSKKYESELLIKIIQMIRNQHLNYHIESAKLYLNRAVIFHSLDQIDLAKNDLVKANNLDNLVKNKPYYPLICS